MTSQCRCLEIKKKTAQDYFPGWYNRLTNLKQTTSTPWFESQMHKDFVNRCKCIVGEAWSGNGRYG
jgi:hypothetical protein